MLATHLKEVSKTKKERKKIMRGKPAKGIGAAKSPKTNASPGTIKTIHVSRKKQ